MLRRQVKVARGVWLTRLGDVRNPANRVYCTWESPESDNSVREREKMPDLNTHSADLCAIADAYRDQRDAGAVDHTAFVVAMTAYRERHPDVARSEAALIISQLVGEYQNDLETIH